MKYANPEPDVTSDWMASEAFWMRSAGFPLMWLETCVCPENANDDDALQGWFNGNRIKQLAEFLKFARDPHVAEAISLSNPDAFNRIKRLAESDLAKINNRNRQRLRLYWMYMQRLCAKNDTCSFFGPVSWGRIAQDETLDCFDVIDQLPDEDRQIFVEHWFVQRIADQIYADPASRAALPVRLNNGVSITAEGLTVPVDREVKLKPKQIAQLQEIVDRQRENEHILWGDLSSSSFLVEMHSKGVIETTILVPTILKYPLHWLQEHVEALGLGDWSVRLDRLNEILNTAAQRTGENRAKTLQHISEISANWGVDLRRRAGEMYVGRYPTYEDAHRKINLTLSKKTAQRITQDIGPILSAYTTLVDRVAARLDRIYACILTSIMRDGDASLLAMLHAISEADDIVEAVVESEREQLHQLWNTAATYAEVVPDTKELYFTPSQLHAFFTQLLVPCQIIKALPWRYVHSPDIMLIAKDTAAVVAGDFSAVIGETHPGIYMVGQSVASPFRSDDAAIEADLKNILHGTTPIMCDPPKSYQRSNVNLPDCTDLMEIILPNQISRLAQEKVVTASECRVTRGETCVELVIPSKGIRVPLLTAMAGHLHKAIFELAGDLAGRSRGEQLRVGCVVFQRRKWRIETADMPNVKRPAESHKCFSKLSHWAHKMELSRFVFAVIPGEPKPIYVDFQNPLSVDALIKHCKSAPTFSLSEMLPERDELLFSDPRGSFTAEFRMSFIANRQESLSP